MDERERDDLIEAALTAWRPRSLAGAIRPHPAWADLPADDRVAVYRETLRARSIESLLDGGGLSTTGRAVLERIRAGS